MEEFFGQRKLADPDQIAQKVELAEEIDFFSSLVGKETLQVVNSDDTGFFFS